MSHSPDHHPELSRYIESVSASSKLQAKSLSRWMGATDERYRGFAETICAALTHRLFAGEHERGVRAYLSLCQEINREQFHFKKFGAYRTASAREAFDDVYSNEARMGEYIVGLLLSYLFWPNHYKMLRFFQDHLDRRLPGSLCEIGVGHGLLTREAMLRAPGAKVTLVDVSPASLAVTRRLLDAFEVNTSQVEFVLTDFLSSESHLPAADLLVLGEVLEHVDEPGRFLDRARSLLNPHGRLYVSTCANCPAPDHVYLFRSVEEIRALIASSGLAIEAELILPLEENVPSSLWSERRVTINYAAILRAA